MTSFEIYRKTFRFTGMRILTGLTGTALIAGLPVLAFAVTERVSSGTRIGICIGAFVAACILVGLLNRFIGYIFRAGQICIAAEAITTGKMPADPYAQGKTAVKKRFGTVAAFFAIEKIINAIVHQITNSVTRLTDSIGNRSNNDTVRTVGAVVSMGISAMMQFMCACCMAWVFIHPDINVWRAAADGAIVYFRNWKDLLKNTAKVIGAGLLSLILIGGLLFGATHLIIHQAPFMDEMTAGLNEFIAEQKVTDKDGNPIDPKFTPEQWKLIFEGIIALILWGIVHSALIDPYVMISVMNRYLKAGLANPPVRSEDDRLAELSKGYRKALAAAEA